MSAIGILIPEYPGQTHSFFWREIESLNKVHGINTKIISTRLPKQPVFHDWVKQAEAFYLLPVSIWQLVILSFKVLIALPALIGDPTTRSLLLSAKNWRFLPLAARMGWWCRANAITHLHVHSCANSALIAVFNRVMANIPFSIVLHGPIEEYGDFQFQKWSAAEFCFVITELMRKDVVRRFPDFEKKIFIAPMGVDVDLFKPSGIEKQNSDTLFNWFCCARINPAKGYDNLLAAVVLLKQMHPDRHFRIEIAGEDEQGGAGYHVVLQQKIHDMGLSDSVILLGAVSQSAVLEHLQQAHAFVLPSKNEPLGVAFMEAMACGLAVVGTAAGGVPELISSNVDGILVPPEQPAELAEAMLRVMTDAELRADLGRMAVRKIADQFSSKRSAAVLAEQLAKSG